MTGAFNLMHDHILEYILPGAKPVRYQLSTRRTIKSQIFDLYLVIPGCLLFFLLIPDVLKAQKISGFDTNTEMRSINLNELVSGGPDKDGIPSIDNPSFISQEQASDWLEPNEPVIALKVNGEARAYPIQILIWHEIANDIIGGVPVAVNFCPLCYSAIVFDRRIEDETHEFGVSGLLRHSDMIMYDRKTESLWQQFSGEALAGDHTGNTLSIISSQLISFSQSRQSYPKADVMSRETGHKRNYGENLYAGYDDVNNIPFLLDEDELTDKLPPMERVIGVRIRNSIKAYPYAKTLEQHVIYDEIDGEPIVIFHIKGMDNRQISASSDDGATGVFVPEIDGKELEFEWNDDNIKVKQTGSTWNISRKAVSDSLEGKQLRKKTFGDYFAFAWMVFYPDTEIHSQ